MGEQRKLAAIMFTDIVGYTALMSKDEHNALKILKKNRDTLKPLIREYRGEWLKEMGDGSLSIFSSIVDAVNCALRIQKALRKESGFGLRIGIHIGDVVVEDKDIFGDGVNVASRIENLAEKGGICVSGQVYANIRNKRNIEAVSLGERMLKNVDVPMTVYAITEKTETDTPSGLPPDEMAFSESAPSIAVIPFIDMSPEKDQAWFCDGIAEEIVNTLNHVGSLHVAALTSVMALHERHEDVREIGRKLNVETVLEGSVRKAGNRLRITVQFIKVADGFYLWSERYDREMENVFAIQDEISLAIVKALKVKLLGEEKAAIVKRYTDSLEAYNLYLKGRYHAKMYDEENLNKAVKYFEKALEKDPDYAKAYARIAEAYSHLAGLANFPEEAYAKAKEAAKKSLEIDDSLVEAHTALAGIKMDHEWDWAGAEKEYKRAQELDPLLLSIYNFTKGMYIALGKNDEAIELSHRVTEIDPNFHQIYETVISLNCKQGNYKEALNAYKKMKEITGDWNPWSEAQLGYIYAVSGKKVMALKILDTLLEKKNDVYAPALRKAYIASGLTGDSRSGKVLKGLEKRFKYDYVPALSIALVYLGLGENAKVFEWLDKAYEERDIMMIFVGMIPELEKILSDERFKALLEKMNLPD